MSRWRSRPFYLFFLVTALIRYKTIKDTHRFETLAGEINQEKDKLEHLIVLNSKINFVLDSLNMIIDGDCCISINSLNNTLFYNNKIIK